MLEKERWHHVVVGMQQARSLLGPLGPAPWLFHAGLNLLPRIGLIKGWYDMTGWCGSQMKERLDGGKEAAPGVPDLAYHLLERVAEKDDELAATRWLTGDSVLAIVAGRYVMTIDDYALRSLADRASTLASVANPRQASSQVFSRSWRSTPSTSTSSAEN